MVGCQGGFEMEGRVSVRVSGRMIRAGPTESSG